MKNLERTIEVIAIALLAITLIMMASFKVFAASPIIVDPETGLYLGNLNDDFLDENSVNNPFGKHGNYLNENSINNPYGTYGDYLSDKSVTNQYVND